MIQSKSIKRFKSVKPIVDELTADTMIYLSYKIQMMFVYHIGAIKTRADRLS